MRTPFAILAVLLWLILGYFFYQSSNECCATQSTTAAAAVIPAKKEVTGPILFKYKDSMPITSTGWSDIRQKWISGLPADHKLEITGYYSKDEENTSSFKNIGLARANETAKLFKPELNDDQIVLYGALRNNLPMDSKFEAVDFGYKMFNKSIQELNDRVLIYFPFNSVNKLNDTAVESYLDKVAARVIDSGETVALSGHTDNVGDEVRNEKLGQQRADIVAAYLKSKGVAETQIQTSSGGEMQPIATNDTDEGRAQNRRTELRIIKS